MPSILNEISFFQFDNLIRNRIPFLIVNLGADLKSFYSIPLYQQHLETQTITVSQKTVELELQKRKVALHDALLILCHDGSASAQIVDKLESIGYTNVFFAKNGSEKLRADASH